LSTEAVSLREATGIKNKMRLAVFISGRGSNLGALLEQQDHFSSSVVAVFSDQPSAYGLKRARRSGVWPQAVRLMKTVESRRIVEDHGATKIAGREKIDYSDLHCQLQALQIDRILLLGYMRIVPKDFISLWEGRIINLHPSLLPKYPGLQSIQRAFEDGSEVGCSMHDVVSKVDAGRVLRQFQAVSVEELRRLSLNDVELTLHLREQNLLCQVVKGWI
jgi:phosphoribosylglycinamide formyltransferase 1